MANYFSHDYNSRNDRKMVSLFINHGLKGFGAYWCIVEMLYESNGYLMQSECERIAYELRCKISLIMDVINSELFKKDDEKFWSESVLNRLKKRHEKSNKASANAYKRWGNAKAMPTHSERNAIKEKKRKVKESKVNKIFIAPTLLEFQDYFLENKFPVELAQRAWKGYDAAGWNDSRGKPVKNWKQKCQNVWFKDENSIEKKINYANNQKRGTEVVTGEKQYGKL